MARALRNEPWRAGGRQTGRAAHWCPADEARCWADDQGATGTGCACGTGRVT
jgi:hypothetical protein